MKSVAVYLAAMLGLLTILWVLKAGSADERLAARAVVEEQGQAERASAELLVPVAARPEPAPAAELEQVRGQGSRRSALAGEPTPEEPPVVLEQPAPVAVYGRVLDEFGNPALGIEVRIENAPLQFQSFTGSNGSWRIVSSQIELSEVHFTTKDGNDLQTSIRAPQLQLGGPSKSSEPHILSLSFDPPRTGGVGPGGPTPGGPSPGGPTPEDSTWEATVEDSSEQAQQLLRELSSARILLSSGTSGSTHTDATGAFDLGEIIPQSGTRLIYGESLYLGEPPAQELIPDDRPQVLNLPPRPRSGLSIALVGPQSQPAPIPEWATFDLVSLAKGVERGRREPHAWDVELAPGSIVVQGLAPGKWNAWIHCRGAQPIQQVFVVEDERGLTATRIEVAVPEGVTERENAAGAFAVDASNTTVSRDSFSGFDDYTVKGQSHRGFGGKNSDAFFGHTLTGFGTGPVRGAYLEVVLEGVSGMCRNDSIGLEYRGKNASPRWSWHQAIAGLPGVESWNRGDRRRLVLDLSNLPTSDGAISLLEELEDGMLDVFVQDDTAVHSIKLRPYR